MERSAPAQEPRFSSETVNYTHLENPASLSLEDGNGRFYEGKEGVQESATRLEPIRYYEGGQTR